MSHRLAHVEAVGDARAVGDHQRHSRPGLCFQQRFDRLDIAGAEGDVGDVDVAERHGFEPEVLLGDSLASSGELGDCPAWCCLRCLTTGVRVHLGVEHEHIHVATATEHVVETARPDVVGPSVASDDPHGLAYQRADQFQQQCRIRMISGRQRGAQLLDTRSLFADGYVAGIVDSGHDGRREGRDRRVTTGRRRACRADRALRVAEHRGRA